MTAPPNPVRRPLALAIPAGFGVGAILAGAAALGAFQPPELHAPEILAAYKTTTTYPHLTLQYPLDETVFPPEIVAPTFRWRDEQPGADTWLLAFQFQDAQERLTFFANSQEWTPKPEEWETIKRRSREKAVPIAILGFSRGQPRTILSHGRFSISTSRDEVGAPLFYREVNLPFKEAVKDPSRIRWRFGSISSPQPPPVVLEHLPVCGNCHSFSKDGQVLGMDVDYANSKGSYVLTRTSEQMTLATSDIMTWDDFKREDGELTFGLLSQVSPDGRVVISTVKDKSVFVPKPDLFFSQLFFPIKGILAFYRRDTRAFQSLKGADDPQYVQSNPTWSPDGQSIVFARTKAYQLKSAAHPGQVLLTPEECQEFLKDEKPFRFDLYRIPFNDGRGGTPEPVAGASDDGLSNYFPKYSPDGQWIVFCKAKNYMLLQPDSELYIIPAAGGPARRLRGNTPRMNSWHSWSPNSRWLVFSSKANSPYTQLFLTHIDAEGNSTPPVVLSHMTAPDRAANIPEFVNLPPSAIQQIREQFLDDYSFERAANEFYRAGDTDHAIPQYRRAIEINPNNVNAHQRLGFLLYHVKDQFQEGTAHSREALRLDPNNGFAHCDLGMACLHQSQLDDAIVHLSAALRFVTDNREPRYLPKAIRYNLAQAFLRKGRFREGTDQLTEVVRVDPDNPEAHYLLALALASQNQIEATLEHYAKAVALKSAVDTSVNLHDLLGLNYARAGQFDKAVRSAEKALQLAHAAGKEAQARQIEARLMRYKLGVTP